MVTCYIGIGSNVGDRRRYIDEALNLLRHVRGVAVTRVSSIYETSPESDIPQGPYLNGVIELTTTLTPRALLGALNGIEERLGRVRTERNAPRTMDLDILYYGDETVNDEVLTIPHPRIAGREFVQKGLRELGRHESR